MGAKFPCRTEASVIVWMNRARSTLCISMCSRECSLCSVGFAIVGRRNLCPTARLLGRLLDPHLKVRELNPILKEAHGTENVSWTFERFSKDCGRDCDEIWLECASYNFRVPNGFFSMIQGQNSFRLDIIVKFRKKSSPHSVGGVFFSELTQLLPDKNFIRHALSARVGAQLKSVLEILSGFVTYQ